ncbi:MAG TPA: diguanylate cyclase, partial [Solirubrobacteraceae bacterium]
LAAAGGQALARAFEAEAGARRAAAQEALTRAAKDLHQSLDLPTVLNRLCEEATRILDGDYTAVYRGSRGGVVIETAFGLPPEMVGFRLEPGEGLSGKVLTSERSMLTNDYTRIADLPADSPFADVRSCLAVPMSWGGELRGVLTVGYRRPFRVTEDHLRLLETFAELAAVACTNASAHAGLALAARTDGLTGCLNHAALHESLGREIERAERAATGSLSLVMIDLDDFKSVNEQHGHLVGDEVLRRAGHALRQATRPYDVAARYGGDEFALLAVEADEAAAEEIARRAIERITAAIGDLSVGDAGRATAGVAEWQPGLSPTELVAHADRALLYGKHEDGRGQTVLFSSLPDWFRPGRFVRRGRVSGAPTPPPPAIPAWPAAVARPAEERLRDRTRQLARASALGTRLVGMAEPQRILATAADELGRTLGDAACTVLQRREDRVPAHVAGAPLADSDVSLAERALAEGRPVLVTDASAPARLAVPLRVGDAAWGAVVAVAAKPGGLNEDDLHLAEVVVGHAGAALHAALRYATLRLAYDEAVAALSAARTHA